MGQMRVGYGSEFHLLRFLGRHRRAFDSGVLAACSEHNCHKPTSIEWLDFPYDSKEKTLDGEWKSVDFISGHGGDAWKRFWPDRYPGRVNRTGMPSWDAIERLVYSSHRDWLLVEAKAHETEFAGRQAKCGAGRASRTTIVNTLRDVQSRLRASNSPSWNVVEAKWLGKYYQLANRLAILSFLLDHHHDARLLFVYFVRDSFPRRRCPGTSTRWRALIADAHKQMGLPPKHELSDRIHYLFPDVRTGVCR